jgi:Ca-activated chloride channel homolog
MEIRLIVFGLLIIGFLLASQESESIGAQEIRRSQQRPRTAPTAPSPQKETPSDTIEDRDPEVVRVDTELVNTIFTAIDRDHHFVTTLRADHLRILEDEMEQEITVFERKTERPLSLVMLIDTSKSQERTLHDEKLAAKAFISSVMRPAKDKFAVVSFTGKPTIVEPLTGNVTRLQRGVERLRVQFPADNCVEEKPVRDDPLCWSSIWDSVWAGTNEILATTSDDSRRAIILVSDGDDTSSTIKRQEAIESAVKNNVVVYSIGIGDPETYKVEKDTLAKVSDRTGGRAFFPRDRSELQAAFAQVQDELRSQYLLAYSPKNKARNGSYRKVKIEVVNSELRKRGLRLLYREGYYGRKG